MPVACERFRDLVLTHDYEGNTIGEGPLFVSVLLIKIQSPIEQFA